MKFKIQFKNSLIYEGKLRVLKLKGVSVSIRTIQRRINEMKELGWITTTRSGHLRFKSLREIFKMYRRDKKVFGQFFSSVVTIDRQVSINTLSGILDSVLLQKIIDKHNLYPHNGNPWFTKEIAKSNLRSNKAPVSLSRLSYQLHCSKSTACRRKKNMINDGLISSEHRFSYNRRCRQSDNTYKAKKPRSGFKKVRDNIFCPYLSDMITLLQPPKRKRRIPKNTIWERTKQQRIWKKEDAEFNKRLERFRMSKISA